ncbi:MAG: proton-conducting transporter membrane subunit [Candidatus Cloacimonetes bacterium]|nr:proton-conducting transporter membrane subunit [Candidatus Cloacimonadota bacterium]
MMYLYIWLFPILAGFLAWCIKSKSLNTALVFIHSSLHLIFGIFLILPSSKLSLYFGIDSLSIWFFIVSAVLYFAVGLYSLQLKTTLTNKQSSIYAICMMVFVASMDGANLSRDLGLIWVFVETTTLASAMLISFEHHKQSLEAAWKYLFICSVGIALAFVGLLLLVIALPNTPSLVLDTVLALSETISPFWLKVSFVFMLIGFGTKVGLAPMHFWLPDAHSEAPAAVSALLSGALLNTALVPLIRMQGVMNACHLGGLASQLFLVLGLLSMFVAAVFILKVKNYKRLLAYSSIENMGIILIAFALGEYAGKAGLIHVMGHSMIKAAFFLTAGNVYSIFGKKDYDQCGGLLSVNPVSAWLWLLCFAFIIGMPPSPLFVSEFYIVMAMLKSGNIAVLMAFMVLLSSIVYGLGRASLAITMGSSDTRIKLPISQYLPQIALLISAVLLPFILQYLL